ncbi:MAG TPA: fibrobacter succinogenes major paralogous domain-containing protein [Bacteroidales bacterium]|nr:fibrobacter succinogenes major paralogous domain-containing protein [Bacteroidales bacterium]
MKYIIFFQFFILLLFIAVLFNNCVSPPPATDGSCTLIINVDTNCILYVDSVSYGVLKNGDVKKVNVDKGAHLIIAKNLDSTKVLIKQTVVINDSARKVINLKIAVVKIPVPPMDTLPEVDTMTDNNSNVMQAMVKIGKQVWMTKNLNVSNYANGDAIPEAQTVEQWVKYGAEGEGCWCYYENKYSNGSKYGKLYNWFAVVDSRGLAPKGWHIPSDAEMMKLTENLGGEDVAGDKLKSIYGWKDPDNGATNETGFAALPGGYRDSNGAFDGIGDCGYWWSSTDNSASDAWSRNMYSNDSDVSSYGKGNGFSVRCVRDF